MAEKTLKDFDYDYQKYADYLESPECANDNGYSVYADSKGNIYESDDWTKGHGHKNVNNGYDRDKSDKGSRGRSWKNPWLKDLVELSITEEEAILLGLLNNSNNKKEKVITKRK